MYHPTRGGVRGGRDQFSWEEVKVDKHRENYLGHSIKAPVGRWQKGKDLHWYTRDKKAWDSEMEAAKEEVKRIKEREEQAMRGALGLAPKRASRPQGNRLDKHEFSELVKRGSTAEDLGAGHAEAAQVHGLGFSRIKEQEEQAMREALGLAPKRASRPQGNRLDKHEFSELVKRGSTAEDLGAGHAEAAQVHGLGFSRAPRPWEATSSIEPRVEDVSAEEEKVVMPDQSRSNTREKESEDESGQKKRRREERKKEKQERREKRHSRDSDDKRKRRKDKEKRRHDSDSD